MVDFEPVVAQRIALVVEVGLRALARSATDWELTDVRWLIQQRFQARLEFLFPNGICASTP